jgi:CubicO group peptidase (beta-lactamase class C family)
VGLAVVTAVVVLLGRGDLASVASWRVAGLDSGGRLKARVGAIVASERRRGFSGVVLVARRGRPILSSGVGLADRARRIRVTPRTVFDIGSITKNLTLAAALALVEDGRLDLSDRLGELLPGVPADKQAITLRQLLEHRAGLPEYVVDAPGGDFVELSRDQALSRILGRPLRFEPGTEYGYSDAGYTVAAAVIEDVAGRPFEDFLRRRILERGGMASAGFYGDRWPPSRVARGYGGKRHGQRNAPDAWSHVSWSLKGAGGAVASARDLASWARRLAGGAVLAARTVRTFYEILAQPERLPRRNRFVVAYGGANDYGFNSAVVEADRARRLVVVLTTPRREAREPDRTARQPLEMAVLLSTSPEPTPSLSRVHGPASARAAAAFRGTPGARSSTRLVG